MLVSKGQNEKWPTSVCIGYLIKTECWDGAGGGGNISYDW